MNKVLLVLGLSLVGFGVQAAEVSEVDCLAGDIEEQSVDLSNDQLDELSSKCHTEADELFTRAGKNQDKAILIQSSTAHKSATIAKKIRENRVKNQDAKKELELRKVQKASN
jgi:hypothetical protein